MTWDSIDVIDSAEGNVSKYVFTAPGAVAEAVLYSYPDYGTRTVVCCSTQSGCPVGCRFCGAGDRFVRSLTADEIVAQPMHIFDDRGINPAYVQKLQIMFMSMGEPLLNWEAVAKAIEMLSAAYPNAALLISTSGPRVDYAPLRHLSMRIPAIGLQFSIHESTDDARDALIPFEAKLRLTEIAEEGLRWMWATARKPFLNYCAHAQNVGRGDADRLAAIFDPQLWNATISVICERDETLARAHRRQRDLTGGFEAMLQYRGYETRIFNPAGQDDIGGGCGQLWYVQQWMREHPERTRASAGAEMAP